MTERAETGPVRFGDDWPGVFIRGDNAHGYALAIEAIGDWLDADSRPAGGIYLARQQLEALGLLLLSSNHKTSLGLTQLRPWAVCVEGDAAPFGVGIERATLSIHRDRDGYVVEAEAWGDGRPEGTSTSQATIPQALWKVAKRATTNTEALAEFLRLVGVRDAEPPRDRAALATAVTKVSSALDEWLAGEPDEKRLRELRPEMKKFFDLLIAMLEVSGR